ncbi:MAG: GDSL-type esterase/lipase family protein [Oscillospiraceae bacterium]|nr:GDSL-type esterase/lipase family protein [Oscillospiraceae bacterium]
MAESNPSPEERRASAQRRARQRQRTRLANQQKLVFAALFLVSLIIISPFLIRGVVRQNREKAAASGKSPATVQPAQTRSAGIPISKIPNYSEQQADRFFQDTLFIGDSRTVGLKEYGEISKATFFCDIGLSAAKAQSDSLNVSPYGKCTLSALLHTRKYRRIYVMLGINELGNPRGTILKSYGQLLNELKAQEPGAEIITVGNLCVTAEKAQGDSVMNNKNIADLNSQIAALARQNGFRYLDPNSSFADASGALNADYSGDGAHLYGKYYRLWRNWFIYQK